MTVLPDVLENRAVPKVSEVRVSVVELTEVVGLFEASRNCTVIGPRLALFDATPDTALLVNTNLLAGSTMTDVRTPSAPLQFPRTGLTP